jgi:hypothetical protein
MFSEKKQIFETFFCSEVSVFTALTGGVGGGEVGVRKHSERLHDKLFTNIYIMHKGNGLPIAVNTCL